MAYNWKNFHQINYAMKVFFFMKHFLNLVNSRFLCITQPCVEEKKYSHNLRVQFRNKSNFFRKQIA